MKTIATAGVLVLGMSVLAGCEPIALTAFGVGTATGVQHTLGGITYRTFTAPLPRVRTAANGALNQMGIKGATREKTNGGEVLKATAAERQIEIELDAITSNTTRMRASVRNGLFMDAATATEIILQTERTLNQGSAASASRN